MHVTWLRGIEFRHDWPRLKLLGGDSRREPQPFVENEPIASWNWNQPCISIIIYSEVIPKMKKEIKYIRKYQRYKRLNRKTRDILA